MDAALKPEKPDPGVQLHKAAANWRERTWRGFRYALLIELSSRHSVTVDELVADPPRVLGLDLNRDELTAILESARRRGLVRPLDHRVRADDAAAPTEWVLTSTGLKATRGPMSWLREKFGPVGRVLRLIIPVLGLLGIGATIVAVVREIDLSEAAVFSLVAIYVGGGALIVGSWIWSRQSGASVSRPVLEDWARYREDAPAWYRELSAPLPWKSLVAGLVAYATALTLMTWFAEGLHPVAELVLIVLPLLALPLLANFGWWALRWRRAELAGQEGHRGLREPTTVTATIRSWLAEGG